jgi:hypothetical protein
MTDDFTLKITVAMGIVISTLEIHFLFFRMNFVKVLIPPCGVPADNNSPAPVK